MAGAEPRLAAVGVELAAEIGPAGSPLPAVCNLAHGGAAVHALHQAGQQMGLPAAVGFRPEREVLLDGGEGLPVNNGLVGALHPVPLLLRNIDQNLGFVADLPAPALDHGARVHLIVEDAPNRGLVPEAVVIFCRMATGPAPLRFIPGRAWNTLLIEHIGNALLAAAFQ